MNPELKQSSQYSSLPTYKGHLEISLRNDFPTTTPESAFTTATSSPSSTMGRGFSSNLKKEAKSGDGEAKWPSTTYTKENLRPYKKFPVLYGERKFARTFVSKHSFCHLIITLLTCTKTAEADSNLELH